jgi:hypothetical protein
LRNLRFFNFLGLAGAILVVCLVANCSRKDSKLDNEVLIRVGDRVVTVFDFNKVFEITKTAYLDDEQQQADDLRKAKLRLLNQMAVELLIEQRAQELGLEVTDAELEKAIADIKSDYPEGEFEKTLLENTVSYDTWKNRLRVNLIMAKVVKVELEDRISITPEDVAVYYKKHYSAANADSSSARAHGDLNEIIVKQLRRQKAEQAYNGWIEKLKENYALEINQKQWDRLLGSAEDLTK